MINNELNYSFVTVLSNKNYIPGLIALKNSLDNVKSKYPLTVLIPEEKSDELSQIVQNLGCKVITRPNIVARNSGEFANHHWDNTFFKLSVVSLTEFDKIVLLDSDMLIAKNIDHLFEKPHMSAVVSGKALEPSFTELNSGIMVIEPNVEEFNNLVSFIDIAISKRAKSGLPTGDQDVFHVYMPEWASKKELNLPEEYNTFFSQVPRLLKSKFYKNKEDIYVIHFIGSKKPWNYTLKDKFIIFLKNLKYFNFASLAFLKRYLKFTKSLTKNK